MTSGQYGLYAWGDTHATMADTTGREVARLSQSLKVGLSSNWRLKPASMKLESLVIADQPCRGEYVLGACTHRPSVEESQNHPKSADWWPKVGLVISNKS